MQPFSPTDFIILYVQLCLLNKYLIAQNEHFNECNITLNKIICTGQPFNMLQNLKQYLQITIIYNILFCVFKT
jgi:hypothetical protein